MFVGPVRLVKQTGKSIQHVCPFTIISNFPLLYTLCVFTKCYTQRLLASRVGVRGVIFNPLNTRG
jgi:hypothetical protein